jgi:hypothetical protein
MWLSKFLVIRHLLSYRLKLKDEYQNTRSMLWGLNIWSLVLGGVFEIDEHFEIVFKSAFIRLCE